MAADKGERRVALVVGNGAYNNTSWLANPPNDAAAMSEALARLDFEVLDGRDVKFPDFAGRIRDFGRALREAHVALFFYAGHGLQVKGENYVVPVDAALEHEADVQLELIAVQTILAQMEVGNRTSLVILDACRDNPLARNLARAMGTTRSAAIGDGLGQLESGIGTYIAFATAPNKLALDGDNARNSPFTEALLRHIHTPGLNVTDLMMRVRQDVIEATRRMRDGPQVPWDNSSLIAPFYFKRRPNAASQEPVRPNPAIVTDRAERDWERFQIAETEHIPTIEAYIAQYQISEPLWAVRARQRLDVVQALIAERAENARRERERLEAEEKRRREQETEAQYRANGFVRVALWTPTGDVPRWIAPGAGEGFRDRWAHRGSVVEGPEMVIVPSGKFMMGSTAEDIAALTKEYGDYFTHEAPQHRVTIPEPFAIGRFPVTFAEWDAFVAAGEDRYRPADQSWGRADRPVINVSWNDAQAYLAWLSEQSGATYRLPSEAEWEYAARAGSGARYCFGDSEADLDDYGWSAANSGRKTHPVGEKKPNGWGLSDVHGNVWEWVEDSWHGSYKSKPDALMATGGAWTAEGGGARVLRGGSWYDFPQLLRSADRSRGTPDLRISYIGFRVARTLSPL